MATSIPPHNLSEVVDALCALIHNPNASVRLAETRLPLSNSPQLVECLRKFFIESLPSLTCASALIASALGLRYWHGKVHFVAVCHIGHPVEQDRKEIFLYRDPSHVRRKSIFSLLECALFLHLLAPPLHLLIGSLCFIF
jgi:hypothetical protein